VPVEMFTTAAPTTRSQWSDFYTLHPSYTGHASFYDILTGESPFIKTLCEEFERDFENLDIQRMATNIKIKISSRIFNGYSQTICEHNSLSKILYFSGVKGSSLPKFKNTLPQPIIPNFGASASVYDNTLITRRRQVPTCKKTLPTSVSTNVRASASVDSGTLGTGRRQVTCICGAVSNKLETTKKGKNRGRIYYSCTNKKCKQNFIVFIDSLGQYFNAKEKWE
ncbi:unnamed protein product, partial [Meganyctiphanes norvegica]